MRVREKFKIDLITPDELQRIVDAADDHLQWAIEVALNTGVQPGPTELFVLRWDDFDYETGALTVTTPKTAAHHPSHVQYVSKDFLQRLKDRRNFMQNEAVRLSRRRGRVLPVCPYVVSFQGQPVQQLATAWKAAKDKAGVTRRVRLYDIRHFYITHALAAGADLLDLAHRVGHKDANMIVNIYAHLVDEMKSKAAFALPSFSFKASVMPKIVARTKKAARGRRLIT